MRTTSTAVHAAPLDPVGIRWYTLAMSKDDVPTYTQTAIRIPAEWIGELQEIAARLSRPGIPVTQADAMRAAIAEGLAVLRKDLGISTPRPPVTSSDGDARGASAPRRAKKGVRQS